MQAATTQQGNCRGICRLSFWLPSNTVYITSHRVMRSMISVSSGMLIIRALIMPMAWAFS